MKSFKIYMLMFLALAVAGCGAQKEFDPEYVKVTNERAQKIVDEMELESAEKELKVRDLIAEQYRNLSWIQDGRDVKIEKIDDSELSETEKEEEIAELKEEAEEDIDKLHKSYVRSLNKELSPEHVAQVKDGMTYYVVPNTYAAFQDMLPQLTQEQKDTIYTYLIEAREHAMDAGSSDKKHWWFGQYKGKINNYLSAEGYDLNKASEEWHKRLEERKKNGNK